MAINIEDISAIIDEVEPYSNERLSYDTQIFSTNDRDENIKQNRSSHPVTYQQPLSRLGPLPRFSSIIGICDDGLPLLFDLSNPSAGSILIVGSESTGKTQLLQSFLKSTSLLNPPSDVNYYVISPDPDRYYEIANNDHCSGIFSSYERSARELVVELASLAEQRKSGRHMGSVIILAIDNLYAFLKNKEHEIDIHLKWLIRYGPNNGVWCISTIQPQYLDHVKREILVGYKTRLLSLSHSLALTTGLNSKMQFLQPDTFITQIGNQSICFSIPVFD